MSDGSQASAPQDLVVVGSSAGGIEALSVLVASLKPDFPAPIVIAQHLDPNRPSQLASILQRATPLDVVMVTERTAMQPGHVYLVPSNQHVVINDGWVTIEADHRGRPRPSVDLLLSTAAQSHGEGLFAVILTGSGTDGAVGAVEVKNAGGTVIIQNPATARFPSMPLALPPTAIDHVVDLEAIGPLLEALLRDEQIAAPAAGNENAFRTILDLVSQQANIDFHPYKASTILRRIGRRMTATKSPGMLQYVQYLHAHPEEIGHLVSAFLINVTQFFREPEAFAFLAQQILPMLIARARDRDRSLRLWSAGCATGEEAYSLAMSVADLLGAELPEWNVKIFATDLDGAAINFGRTGIYPENLLQNLPDDYRERFFEHVGNGKGYRISKMLRQTVIFGQQDLGRSAPFPRIDLILCRNVLIYFTPALQEHVLNNFAFSLGSHGGYLFLGKAETVRPTLGFYELIDKQWKVYRCSGDKAALPRQPGRAPFQLPTVTLQAPTTRMLDKAPAPETPPSNSDVGQIRRLNELLLRFLPIGVVVIDRTYRMLSINAAARRLLGVREVVGEPDFLHAARSLPYGGVRDAIDTVFRQRSPVTLPELELENLSGEANHFLGLSIILLQTDTGAPDLVAITINDVTEEVQKRRRLETVQVEQARLVAELEVTNKRLNDANKELIDSNEELQIANEELVLTQEELQATVEEFETTNEELQATNEELETSNEELQATNEELETTNEELRATAGELEAMTQVLDTERDRLAGMVELTPFYIIVCRGPELIVEQIDRRFPRLGGPQFVQGQPLRDIAPALWGDSGTTVVSLTLEAYAQAEVRVSPRLTVAAAEDDGATENEYFVFTVVPSRDQYGDVTGVVLYAANETMQQLQARQEEYERLRLIFDTVDQMALALYDAQTEQLLMASKRYLQMIATAHTADPAVMIGQTYSDLVIYNDPRGPELWQEVVTTRREVYQPEVRLTLPDGTETVWDRVIQPIMEPRQPAGVQYVLVTGVEITAQTRAREALERTEQLRDEFMSLASHELRTPLTSLIGYLHLLERLLGQEKSVQNSERIQTIVGTLSRQVQRLKRLIDDLVDISRLQSGKLSLKLQPLPLIPLVERAVNEAQMINPALPIHVFVQPDDGSISLEGDPDRLLQVIINLIQNAMTYAAQSPQIDVRLTRERDANGLDIACVEVRDYGPGIPPDQLQAIFNRFHQITSRAQRPSSGLGLGLYISQQIVVQHGGTIAVQSTVGEGSSFSVRLPVAQVEAPARQPETAP